MKRYAVNYILTQMSAKAGIRKHGRAAEAALTMAEFAQLDALDVYVTVDPCTLTQEQKKSDSAMNLKPNKLLRYEKCIFCDVILDFYHGSFCSGAKT